MLVEQLGNKNQFKVFLKNGVAFQSYSTLIAIELNDGSIYVSNKWDYSATTLRYFKRFLGITNTKKEIQKLLDEDVYHLVSETELASML
jgi:pantothenate kinase